jgi:hypothetical protein
VEPISVPAPPKSSFNKNRRVSDLLLAQLKHFQHVEHKQGITIDPALARDIQTEAGAARYITQITRAIRSQSKPSGIAVVPSTTPATKPASKTGGLAIAAAAASPSLPAKTSGKKKSVKRKKP